MDPLSQHLRNLAPGDTLCRENDPADRLWIVEFGTFHIYRDGHFVTQAAQTEVLGEQGLLGVPAETVAERSKCRNSTLIAATKCKIWIVHEQTIDQLSPEARYHWADVLARVLSDKLLATSNLKVDADVEHSASLSLISRFVDKTGQTFVQGLLQKGDEFSDYRFEQVSAVVWFSDIAGFSKAARGKAPKDIGRLLDPVMHLKVSTIQEHGGEIEVFTGDGLTAFWICRSDDQLTEACSKAVSAARTVLESFPGAKTDPLLGLRIGLHAGNALAGNFGANGRIAYSLTGEMINDGSRYESARVDVDGHELGPIRISPSVHERISSEQRGVFKKKPRRFVAKHDALFAAYVLKAANRR
ncbi:MAG: cyclic nucleotide-binding domain-containing protein [Pseudomonadota bacterium]